MAALTQNAFAISVASVLIGTGVAYLIYKWTSSNLVKRGQKLLANLAAISIAIGIGWIANEWLGNLVWGSPIRNDFIAGKVITNLLFLPAVFWGIIWIRGGFRDKSNIATTETIDTYSSQNITVKKPANERHYEVAIREYESNDRSQGLYAKLLVEENGNENQVKVNYLRQRAAEIAMHESELEKQEEQERQRIASPLYQLRAKKFTAGNVHGIECLILENGMGVILTSARDYRIYVDEDSMVKSAMNHKFNKSYLNEGYLQTIERDDVLFPQ